MKRILEIKRCNKNDCPYHRIFVALGKPVRSCMHPDSPFGYLANQEHKDGFPVKCPLKECGTGETE